MLPSTSIAAPSASAGNTNLSDPSTLPASRPTSSLSCRSNSSGSRPPTTNLQHQQQNGTPAGVYSASLRTGSSAGTTSSEEATVSNLRGAHTTQPLTGGIVTVSLGGTGGGEDMGGKRPSQPPTTNSKFGSLGKAMRVASGTGTGNNGTSDNGGGHLTSTSVEYIAPVPPAGAVTPAAQFRTPGGAPVSAIRPRLMHTPLITLREAPEKTPLQQPSAGGRAAIAAAAAAPRQLVLEDGPAAAMEEPTARVRQQSTVSSLVGIPEDPGATVPLSRPVVPTVVQPPPPQQQQQQQRNVDMPPPPRPAVATRPQAPAPPSTSKFYSIIVLHCF